MSQNLYQDRRAWQTLFDDGQEFIFVTGDWSEREREREGGGEREREKIGDGCAKWVGILCIKNHIRGGLKLDRLIDVHPAG